MNSIFLIVLFWQYTKKQHLLRRIHFVIDEINIVIGNNRQLQSCNARFWVTIYSYFRATIQESNSLNSRRNIRLSIATIQNEEEILTISHHFSASIPIWLLGRCTLTLRWNGLRFPSRLVVVKKGEIMVQTFLWMFWTKMSHLIQFPTSFCYYLREI